MMKTIHHYVVEMVKTGKVERVSRGVYRKANTEGLASPADNATRKP